MVKALILPAMIPQDLTTVSVKSFIDKLTKCQSQEELDDVVDEPLMLEVLNSTQWNLSCPVSLQNRDQLIQEIICNEICRKSRDQLAYFSDGLKAVPGFFSLLEKYSM